MQGKRQAIVDTALRLFYANGYHAVGVDRIIAESGVAKMTLYKFFPTKRELISAILEHRDREFQESLRLYVDKERSPAKKIEAIFKWHDLWLHELSFNGCMFISASIEFADPSDALHVAAMRHKKAIEEFMSCILMRMMSSRAAGDLARQLLLLLEGAVVTAQLSGDRDAASTAWKSARILLSAKQRGTAAVSSRRRAGPAASKA
jgi:AcrR family transcriptional regulator